MSQRNTQGTSPKNLLSAFLLLAIIGVIGFFIYPAIIYQKDAPGIPSGLEGESGDEDVTLIWIAPESNDAPISSYLIKVADQDGKDPQVVQSEGSATEYKVVGLTNGLIYTFSVAARNEFGDSEFSEEIQVKPDEKDGGGDSEFPGVTDFQVSAESSSIMLSWTPPTGDTKELQGYVIRYKQPINENYTEEYVGSDKNEYTIEGLKSGTEYLVHMYVKYNEGDSDLSEERSITTSSNGGGGDDGELSFSDAPSVSITSTSAQITWGTSKSASSQVYYGATDNMGYMTEKMNTTPRVTGHTVSLTNLVPCTAYVYKVASFDASENGIESTSGEFTTKGCKGDATVIVAEKGQATVSTGVTVNAKESGRGISVVVPPAVVAGKELAIQALKVSREEVKEEISKPEGKVWVGGSYVLNAIEDATTEITSFDKSVSVSIDYNNTDIVGIDPNTLKIWHYEDGAGWRQLSSCSVVINGVGGTVTCQTSSFSVFGLFGDSSSNNQSDSPEASSGPNSSGSTPKTVVVNTPTSPAPVVPPTNSAKFTKDLWYQIQDVEVVMLQKFLNMSGFKVSETGPGASGEETDYFGSKTRDALVRFQEAYKDKILTPLGLTVGIGFFGPQTRNFINSLSN